MAIVCQTRPREVFADTTATVVTRRMVGCRLALECGDGFREGLPLTASGFRGAVLLASWLLAVGMAVGQPVPTFAIRGYQVEGSSLLPMEQVTEAVMPFTGDKSTFDTIQLALEALEKAYTRAGYAAVRIEVPEQDLSGGVVKLIVVEARLDQIVVQGPTFHDEANILQSLPALRKGEVVNVNALQRNLDLANDNFSKRTTVTFRQSEASAQTDAIVRVADDEPLRFIASLDNSGNQSTGRYRAGFSVFHANLFNRDHSIAAQLLTSPTRIDKVAIIGVGYHLPLYTLGSSVDLTLGYSNVDSGRIDLFSVSGSGRILGLRYNQALPMAGGWQQKLSYGLDYRAYGSQVVPLAGGASQIPDLEVHPVGLTYSASLRSARRDVSATLSLLHNLPGGRNGSTAAFNQPGARAGSDAAFTTLKLSADLTERLASGWALRGALQGQYSRDLLIAAEQFGAGGADSVRGFAEREIAGDNGLRASVEAWGPDLGPQLQMTGLRLQPIVFLDAAWVRYNVAPGTLRSQSIASIGVGLRGSYERRASYRIDLGRVVNGATNAVGATGATDAGSWRLHGSLLWFF